MSIVISNDDPNKSTITYLKALNIVSDKIRVLNRKVTLKTLVEDLSKENIKVSQNILSRIKNKHLEHAYPDTVAKLLSYFGYENVKLERKVLITFDIETKKFNENGKRDDSQRCQE